MHITLIMIVTFIACCARVGTGPWKYWQINAKYFSDDQGIFSKLSIDKLIPERWRLFQSIDNENISPTHYPVFLKPEWGQNAHGIHRADDQYELNRLRVELSGKPQRYMLQQAAQEQHEYEIFNIKARQQDNERDVITVTEAVNGNEDYPINSKYNRHTRYIDVSAQFTTDQLAQLSGFISEIGDFGISRMSVRADSHAELLAGHFHVIEINLFLPMPINLLDSSYSWKQRLGFIGSTMMSLAHATKAIKPAKKPQPIFAKMVLYGREKKRKSSTQGMSTATRRTIL
ncbi:MAG: hypothetical protein V3U65_01730 [Granulosicoccaceae bacterium]